MESRTLDSSSVVTAQFDRASLADPRESIHLLRRGEMATMVSAAGGGYVHFDHQAVTRWRHDPTCDGDGYFVYLRDLDSGRVWSATYQPTKSEPDDYRVVFRPNSAQFTRRDGNVTTTMEISLAPSGNADIRRVTLTNQSDKTRHLELTSYAEMVLQDPAGRRGSSCLFKIVRRDRIVG